MTEPNGHAAAGPRAHTSPHRDVVTRDVGLEHGTRLLFVPPTSNTPQGSEEDSRRSSTICRPHYAQDYVINRVVDFGH